MESIKKLIVLLHERYLQKDKRQHFAVSLFLFLSLYFFVSVGSALLLTFAVGLLKEVWDELFGSGFCFWDMMANCVGILVGLLLISVYYVATVVSFP